MNLDENMTSPRTLARSLFKNESHYESAKRLITLAMTYKIGVTRDEKGFVTINDMLDLLAKEDDTLGYLDFEHLIEVLLRHTPYTFSIEGDFMVPLRPVTADMVVDPPRYLYFGTSQGVAEKAIQKGLISYRNELVTMTSDRVLAENRARSFSKDKENARPVLLVIDAEAAHAEGMTFIGGDKQNLYKAAHISRTHLTHVVL